jgi:hypothetical protein
LVRWARIGEAIFSPTEWVGLKLKIHSETLYHLICAISVAERDREKIYPDDFRYPRVPLWREEKAHWPDLGLRDCTEITKLLFKHGGYQREFRQKAASPVRPPSTPLAQISLVPTETQRLLERAGRLYKNSSWPSKRERCLFDKCAGKRQSWVEGRRIESNAVEEQARVEWREKARVGGEVKHLEPPAQRYARLERTRASYNERWGSHWNGVGQSRRLRDQRSLNIPHDPILVEKLEHDNEQSVRPIPSKGKRYA